MNEGQVGEGEEACIEHLNVITSRSLTCFLSDFRKVCHIQKLLSLDDAAASRAVFVVVSWSNGWAETLLKPAK